MLPLVLTEGGKARSDTPAPAARGFAIPDIAHKFTSAIADGGDATLVRPSNWNDAHVWPDAYDQGTLDLADGQYNFQLGRLTVSSTNRMTMAGTARILLFGWFNMPDPASFQIVGSPFTFSNRSFRLPTGFFYNVLDRLTLETFSRGVLQDTGRLMLRDDFVGSRVVLTGRG